MKHFILAASALAVLASAPASAQYYGGGRYGDDDQGDYGDYAPRRYREYREYRPRPYDETEREYRPRRYERRWSQAPLGSVCVTSRGSCDTQGDVPIDAPCSCFIPGFGMKRGAVGY
jgi:hypothetical protein